MNSVENGSFVLVLSPLSKLHSGSTIVTHPQDAEVILINGDGIIEPATGDIIQAAHDTQGSFVSALQQQVLPGVNQFDLWCPFGTC